LIVARLRHVTSGAVVQVTDEKAGRLGSEWEVIPEPKQSRKPKVETKQD
jgi:hypothetical protein